MYTQHTGATKKIYHYGKGIRTMARSRLTNELYNDAHDLGDEFYRLTTRSIKARGKLDDECVNKGKAYLEALEALRRHIDTLENSRENEVLKRSTETYITLAKKELDGIAKVSPEGRSHVDRDRHSDGSSSSSSADMRGPGHSYSPSGMDGRSS